MPEESLVDNGIRLRIALAAVLCMFEHCSELTVPAGNCGLCTLSDSATKVMVDRESHPIRSLHLRCGDSEVGSRGTVIASEHSERAFDPGGMQRIKLQECNDRTVAA